MTADDDDVAVAVSSSDTLAYRRCCCGGCGVTTTLGGVNAMVMVVDMQRDAATIVRVNMVRMLLCVCVCVYFFLCSKEVHAETTNRYGIVIYSSICGSKSST